MAQMTITPVATHGFLVDGRWIEDGNLVEVRAPYDGAVIGRVFQGTRQHAEAAIAAAVKAVGTTRRLPAFERQPLLRRGAPGITPFNLPLNLVAHKVAPAIASGCSMVLKPAPQTPLSALLLAETIQQAGWPDGALNVLPLSNEDAGVLVTDGRLKMISFTGSAAVGWEIKKRAGKKKVVLELGGNAGVIVHSDADLAYAAERCVAGGFVYAGQTCISVQRILVEHSVYGKFTELLLA